MKIKLYVWFALGLGMFLAGCSTAPSSHGSMNLAGNEVDSHLTKQISNILIECQAIKPGMTRAELLKVFTTEGGLFSARQRTFVYRSCPYIKVDVSFNVTDTSSNRPEERPADTISTISKPYLEFSVGD